MVINIPTVGKTLPPLAARIVNDPSRTNRANNLARVHPSYAEQAESWRILLNDFEGLAGFLNGDYIWRFKNETTESYDTRRSQARHIGYLETLVDLYTHYVFSQAPKRTTSDDGLKEFWGNVDLAGNDITDFMRRLVALSLVAGHCGALLDATSDTPAGPARADQHARLFLSLYTAPNITDWRLDHGSIVGVKLIEQAPKLDITAEPLVGMDASQWLLWDRTAWARFDIAGELINANVHNLGLVPLAIMRPKPSMIKPFLGRPLIANAKMLQSLFNRLSELDQVLRDQSSSLLVVEVPADGDGEQARKNLGTDVGTTTAIVVQGVVKFVAPDQKVPEAVRESIRDAVREIYRVAHVRFERDSLSAESAEAIRLQSSELNEVLQGIGAAAADVERAIARFYFGWTNPTPEAAQRAFEAADVSVEYPDEFFADDLQADLQAWAEAVSMQLGETMNKRLKKRAVRRIDPEMPPNVLDAVDAEIDNQADQTSGLQGAADQLRRGATQRLAAIRAQQTKEQAS
jgi:hypothetical protein